MAFISIVYNHTDVEYPTIQRGGFGSH